MPPKDKAQSGGGMDEAHQHQAGSTTHREEDEWKHREPYKIHDKQEGFDAKWKGKCHCGKVKYELSRDKPLASKYCHCGTCQKLHGVSTLEFIRLRVIRADNSLGIIPTSVYFSERRYQLHPWAPRSRLV